MNAKEKIITLDQASTLIASLKSQGKTVVCQSGSFDILHGGHVAIVEEAKSQGDFLIVLVNSDKSVQSYKGPLRPYVREHDRALLVAGMSAVDVVVLFDELNPISALEKLQPQVYVNGSDWGEKCIEAPTVKSYGGRIHIVGRGEVSGESSSAIVKRIQSTDESHPVRAVFVDRDGVILEDVGYLHEVEKTKILPNVAEGLKKMQDAGFILLVVTNQSGIGRGKYPVEDMHAVNEYMVAELAKSGVHITHVYFCPHAPEANCACRKPKPGSLLDAVKDYNVVLEKSYMIGDKSSDVECGRFANAKAILINSGQYAYDSEIEPNHTVKDLFEASSFVV